MMELLMGLTLLTGGMFVLAQSFAAQRLLRASRHWISTPGQVQHAGVLVASRLWGLALHRAKVVYDYHYEGRDFRGDTLLLGGELSVPFRPWAFEHSREFVSTAAVWVWVDPHNPHRSCLRRAGERSLFSTGLGLAFALLGALVLTGNI